MTSRMWMNPPSVYDETTPTSHRTRRMTKIVQSMLNLRSILTLPQTPFDVASSRQVVRCKPGEERKLAGGSAPPSSGDCNSRLARAAQRSSGLQGPEQPLAPIRHQSKRFTSCFSEDVVK